MILKRAIAPNGTVFRRVAGDHFHRTGPALTNRAQRPSRSLLRTFEASVKNRLSADWDFSPLSADAELRQSYRNLRARSREQERNDSYAEHFYALAEQNVIGANGIGLQAKLTVDSGELDDAGEPKRTLDTAKNRKVERAWKRQCRRENYTTTRDQSATAADKVILRSALRDGDLLVRLIRGYPNEFGFAVQIIEGDYLDDTYTDFRAVPCNCPEERGLPRCQSGFHEVRMGVELHGDWKFPVAYWLLSAHPGDYMVGTAVYAQRRERVPVEDIIHPFIRKRPGQTRGYPALACAMLRLRMLGGYSEAELMAARVAAIKMGFIESDVPESLFDQYYDKDERMGIIDAAAAEIEELPVGKRFKEWDPQHPNGNFPAFAKEQIRAVAAGGNVSYTSLSGNIEDVNFSSIRAGLLEEREGWKSLQTWFIDEVKRLIFEAWAECALLSGNLDLSFDDLDDLKDQDLIVWKPRRWPWVDPSKDLQSKKDAIDANLDTASSVIAETGGDLEEVYAERAYEKELAEKLGITQAPPEQQKPAGEAEPDEEQPVTKANAPAQRSAYLGDATIQDLPEEVQKTIAQFELTVPDSKVIRYGMTVPELLNKADQHNLETARRHIRNYTVAGAAQDVYDRPDKAILLMQDRIVDGHHHLAKAEKGKVTRSLPVIDITPLRFQPRPAAPAANG